MIWGLKILPILSTSISCWMGQRENTPHTKVRISSDIDVRLIPILLIQWDDIVIVNMFETKWPIFLYFMLKLIPRFQTLPHNPYFSLNSKKQPPNQQPKDSLKPNMKQNSLVNQQRLWQHHCPLPYMHLLPLFSNSIWQP